MLIVLLANIQSHIFSQCNQHVFTSVGATEYTQYQYQDCEGLLHWFNLPIGGYTIILCADIGTAFVLNGDGFVYPLQNEHPSFPSCFQEGCPGDLDEDGEIGAGDLIIFLTTYGTQCEN